MTGKRAVRQRPQPASEASLVGQTSTAPQGYVMIHAQAAWMGHPPSVPQLYVGPGEQMYSPSHGKQTYLTGPINPEGAFYPRLPPYQQPFHQQAYPRSHYVHHPGAYVHQQSYHRQQPMALPQRPPTSSEDGGRPLAVTAGTTPTPPPPYADSIQGSSRDCQPQQSSAQGSAATSETKDDTSDPQPPQEPLRTFSFRRTAPFKRTTSKADFQQRVYDDLIKKHPQLTSEEREDLLRTLHEEPSRILRWFSSLPALSGGRRTAKGLQGADVKGTSSTDIDGTERASTSEEQPSRPSPSKSATSLNVTGDQVEEEGATLLQPLRRRVSNATTQGTDDHSGIGADALLETTASERDGGNARPGDPGSWITSALGALFQRPLPSVVRADHAAWANLIGASPEFLRTWFQGQRDYIDERSAEIACALEQSFRQTSRPSLDALDTMAAELSLPFHSVCYWFQARQRRVQRAQFNSQPGSNANSRAIQPASAEQHSQGSAGHPQSAAAHGRGSQREGIETSRIPDDLSPTPAFVGVFRQCPSGTMAPVQKDSDRAHVDPIFLLPSSNTPSPATLGHSDGWEHREGHAGGWPQYGDHGQFLQHGQAWQSAAATRRRHLSNPEGNAVAFYPYGGYHYQTFPDRIMPAFVDQQQAVYRRPGERHGTEDYACTDHNTSLPALPPSGKRSQAKRRRTHEGGNERFRPTSASIDAVDHNTTSAARSTPVLPVEVESAAPTKRQRLLEGEDRLARPKSTHSDSRHQIRFPEQVRTSPPRHRERESPSTASLTALRPDLSGQAQLSSPPRSVLSSSPLRQHSRSRSPAISISGDSSSSSVQVVHRTPLSMDEQCKELAEVFKRHPRPSSRKCALLAEQLGMAPRVVEIYFERRRKEAAARKPEWMT